MSLSIFIVHLSISENMQKSFLIFLVICNGSVLFAQQTRILGFYDSSTKVELNREKIFDDLISRENIGLTHSGFVV